MNNNNVNQNQIDFLDRIITGSDCIFDNRCVWWATDDDRAFMSDASICRNIGLSLARLNTMRNQGIITDLVLDDNAFHITINQDIFDFVVSNNNIDIDSI